MSTKRYKKNTAFLESATEINQMKGSIVKNKKKAQTQIKTNDAS